MTAHRADLTLDWREEERQELLLRLEELDQPVVPMEISETDWAAIVALADDPVTYGDQAAKARMVKEQKSKEFWKYWQGVYDSLLLNMDNKKAQYTVHEQMEKAGDGRVYRTLQRHLK